MQLAMRVLLRAAEVDGATRFIDVCFAHIAACFYNGQAHVDFAQYRVDNGAYLSVPTWANTGLVSLVDGELHFDDAEAVQKAVHLMRLYEYLGCRAVWTCAPYQLPGRPKLGDHIIGSESNAVTFYNSVVGARTNKYGDFIDVCAALVGAVSTLRWAAWWPHSSTLSTVRSLHSQSTTMRVCTAATALTLRTAVWSSSPDAPTALARERKARRG